MKPNWRLIAILAGAVLTVGLVIVMFASTAGTAQAVGLPTTTALSSTPAGTKMNLDVSVDSGTGCAFVTDDEVRSLAIWPAGYTLDAEHAVLDDTGTPLGATIDASATTLGHAAVLELSGGGDDDYLGRLVARCQDTTKPITVISAVHDGQ